MSNYQITEQEEKDRMKQELLNFVIDHLKHFKCYPIEFEYNNKVYDYKFIIETIQKRKETYVR